MVQSILLRHFLLLVEREDTKTVVLCVTAFANYFVEAKGLDCGFGSILNSPAVVQINLVFFLRTNTCGAAWCCGRSSSWILKLALRLDNNYGSYT